jgi:hypothetical protein
MHPAFRYASNAVFVAAVAMTALAGGYAHATTAQDSANLVPKEVGDVVEVRVTAQCPTDGTLSKYQLMVEGAPSGITAQGCKILPAPPEAASDAKVKPAVASVVFLLHLYGDAANTNNMTPENSVAWRTLIGIPWDSNGFQRVRTINVGVTNDKGEDITAADNAFRFIWAPVWKLCVGLLVIAFVVVVFVLLGARTALLRDAGATTSVPFRQRSFSLSRTQMAWWTLIIVASYMYIWIATGTQPTLTSQALALLGINSGVAAASRGVDLTRQTAFPPQVRARFFFDLISDESGVAMHRLQMLVFTVLVGANFLYQVIVVVAMPTLDVPTLALIGLSGATYVGFKVNEPQPKQDGSPDTEDASGKTGYSTGATP